MEKYLAGKELKQCGAQGMKKKRGKRKACPAFLWKLTGSMA